MYTVLHSLVPQKGKRGLALQKRCVYAHNINRIKTSFQQKGGPLKRTKAIQNRSPDSVREMTMLNLFPLNNVIEYSSLLVRYALSNGANFDDLNLHVKSRR